MQWLSAGFNNMTIEIHELLQRLPIPVLVLDKDLHIRSFSASITKIYNIIPGDVGRYIDDLKSFADDEGLTRDARAAVVTFDEYESEILVRPEQRYIRRISPYSYGAGNGAGIVITYREALSRQTVAFTAARAAKGSPIAESDAVLVSKVVHDLRQPLQAFSLLHGLLLRHVVGDKARSLIARLDDVLGSMSEALDSLLAVDQINHSTIRADATAFQLNEIFQSLAEEFRSRAKANNVRLQFLKSSVPVMSDRRLLEQLLRNLLANAVRCTSDGRIVVGCRRRGKILQIEIWDGGVRSSSDDIDAFAAHPGPDRPAPPTDGQSCSVEVSLVKRLAAFLGHRVGSRVVRKNLTVFTVEILIAQQTEAKVAEPPANGRFALLPRQSGTVLTIQAGQVSDGLLEMALREDDYQVQSVGDLAAARTWFQAGHPDPHVIIADLEQLAAGRNGSDGAIFRDSFWHRVPSVILTGDISNERLREIDRRGLIQMKKPVRLDELSQIVGRLMPRPIQLSERRRARSDNAVLKHARIICVVDDDVTVREAVSAVFEDADFIVRQFASGEAFLAQLKPEQSLCLLVDAYLPGISGLDLLRTFKERSKANPAIMITGSSDVSTAVQAMKAGAFDFIEKPAHADDLLASVRRAIDHVDGASVPIVAHAVTHRLTDRLSKREQEVLEKVLEGQPSKHIAIDLGISKRTVENHRASIMKKTGSTSLPGLARLAFEDRDPNGSSLPPELRPEIRIARY